MQSPSENSTLENKKTPPPTKLDDPIDLKSKQITKESDLKMNQVSTQEEIKNRKILKIAAPKGIEVEEDKTKRNFTFNNVEKDKQPQTGNNLFSGNLPSLFSNPFTQKNTEGLFGNKTMGLFGTKLENKKEEDQINKPEEKKGLFSEKPNPFNSITPGESLFKNPFNNNTSSGSLFGNINSNNQTSNSLFGNKKIFPSSGLLGTSTAGIFNTNINKTFENSDEDDGDFEDPEKEIEITNKPSSKRENDIKIEVNEKLIKIPVAEFSTYDFTEKKYKSIGKGDFSIEYSKNDEKKETPLLIFRNSVLKILFQGMFKKGVTKLETVNKNFKTISIIQKVFFLNPQINKTELKAIKIQHQNESDSKLLVEKISELDKESQKSDHKEKEEKHEPVVNINQMSKNQEESKEKNKPPKSEEQIKTQMKSNQNSQNFESTKVEQNPSNGIQIKEGPTLAENSKKSSEISEENISKSKLGLAQSTTSQIINLTPMGDISKSKKSDMYKNVVNTVKISGMFKNGNSESNTKSQNKDNTSNTREKTNLENKELEKNPSQKSSKHTSDNLTKNDLNKTTDNFSTGKITQMNIQLINNGSK